MIQRFGKSLERAFRKLRPHLVPAYRQAFKSLVARGLLERREGERIVCCDFSNSAIDAVGGRYYFSLVRDLIDAEYFPVFTARRGTLSSFGTRSLKSLLLTERMGVVPSYDDIQESYFLITDDPNANPQRAERIVMVSYEWRLCQNASELAFPVFIHPWIASGAASFCPPHFQDLRPTRLFFGGNTEEGKYDKNIIRDLYGMLSRREMLAETMAATSPEMIYRPRDAPSWLASPDFHPVVFCETQHCKIPPQRWLEALSKADFFLACPGVGMPLCHNLIEAMAAGTIPILQYGNYLPQPLEDGVNCLEFKDSKGLQGIVTNVLAMSQEQICLLREGVQKYYNEFLAPGRFAVTLLSGHQLHRTLLINAYRVAR
jgi:hypothetical protein